MDKWRDKVAPLLYCYSVVLSIIAVGCIYFINESEFVIGEVVQKVVIQENAPRDEYTNTPVRSNNTIFEGEFGDNERIEGSAVTLFDGDKGETSTIHVPAGMGGKAFFDQTVVDSTYYPFVYTGHYAKTDKAKRYLLVIQQRFGDQVIVSVSKRQYERTPKGTNVTVKDERVNRRHY